MQSEQFSAFNTTFSLVQRIHQREKNTQQPEIFHVNPGFHPTLVRYKSGLTWKFLTPRTDEGPHHLANAALRWAVSKCITCLSSQAIHDNQIYADQKLLLSSDFFGIHAQLVIIHNLPMGSFQRTLDVAHMSAGGETYLC